MRILHFITSLRTGGAERLVIDLLPRLAARGHEVGLLLMDGTRTHFFDMARQRGTDVQSLSEGQEAMHDIRLALPLRRLLHRHRYDIVHTHNTPCQILAALAAPEAHALSPPSTIPPTAAAQVSPANGPTECYMPATAPS